jgi:predicted site-specific integrase-resolvase
MIYKIDTVYITYKDRLARLSYELAEKLFDKHNVRIKTIYNDTKTDEQELFEDLMSVIHSFSMKMYSKRRLAKKLLEESNKDETNKNI